MDAHVSVTLRSFRSQTGDVMSDTRIDELCTILAQWPIRRDHTQSHTHVSTTTPLKLGNLQIVVIGQ